VGLGYSLQVGRAHHRYCEKQKTKALETSYSKA
jgi:hypothetical protein